MPAQKGSKIQRVVSRLQKQGVLVSWFLLELSVTQRGSSKFNNIVYVCWLLAFLSANHDWGCQSQRKIQKVPKESVWMWSRQLPRNGPNGPNGAKGLTTSYVTGYHRVLCIYVFWNYVFAFGDPCTVYCITWPVCWRYVFLLVDIPQSAGGKSTLWVFLQWGARQHRVWVAHFFYQKNVCV